ncbi:CcdB family protein [Kosakonia sp. MUSA4]|uniref:CcdB family protein n=1 Tax=Kosakonia sp. MUSA4 TaxID=2067958 RepID=UPI001597E6DE|nr:CcdB family protein [Kosakonia sp. MUSA4]QJT80761.1 plasmid maintenance protein CcdB [Kosakonia sp. MUSA4]
MIKQFDVYRNTDSNPEARKQWPYYMIVQNDYYEELTTRVIIPLSRKINTGWYSAVAPKVNIEFETLMLYSPMITHWEITTCRPQDYVGNLRRERSCVVGAIDALVANI